VADVTGSMHGFPAALTSFVGRAGVVDEVAGLLGQYRLVTVTGAGGAGKTRLAGEVAKQVAGRFADGVWLAELAAVRDPAQVAAAVAAALGIRDLPAVAASDALAHALARRQLLLVLDNCEQVIGAAAELCDRLLLGADDVRVLATSREALRIAGEARYRLEPLTQIIRRILAGRRRWHCSRTGPAGLTRVSRWMGRPRRWWRGWWRGWTGCRWRSSSRRRGSRRWAWRSCWTGSMTGSPCWRPGTGSRRPASGRWRPPWSGVTGCWMNAGGGCSAHCRCSRGRSRWRGPRRSRGPAPGRPLCTWWTAHCWPRRGPARMASPGM
jgi:hypothetical protein